MVSDYNVLPLLCQYRQPYIKMIVCYNLFLYQLYQKNYAILIFLNIAQSHLFSYIVFATLMCNSYFASRIPYKLEGIDPPTDEQQKIAREILDAK